VALTDKEIKNVKPGARRIRLFDERALYLEVSPAGGKWWRLKYRHGGKEKRLSLGVYPDVSLKAARDRRDAARKLLGEGIDPAANRTIINNVETRHHIRTLIKRSKIGIHSTLTVRAVSA